MTPKIHELVYTNDHGVQKVHREKASRKLAKTKVIGTDIDLLGMGRPEDKGDQWENDIYYGTIRRYDIGFPLGGGPYAIIGITSLDESARHDWREYQQIKNDLVGKEWEAVELYPAESRLVDPTNRFFLWCVPKGVFAWGFPTRSVKLPGQVPAAQRAFPEEST